VNVLERILLIVLSSRVNSTSEISQDLLREGLGDSDLIKELISSALERSGATSTRDVSTQIMDQVNVNTNLINVALQDIQLLKHQNNFLESQSAFGESSKRKNLDIIYEHIRRLSLEVAEFQHEICESKEFRNISIRRMLPISIYLSGQGLPHRAENSLKEALTCIGFNAFAWDNRELSSWYRRLFARSRDALTSQEVTERLQKVERAIQIKGIDLPQTEADLNHARAASEVLKAIEHEQSAAILLGSLCVLKVDGAVFVISLTQEQMTSIRDCPQLLRRPDELHSLLFGPREAMTG
jgi:hypothetical protein